jgi:hypothetical protein
LTLVYTGPGGKLGLFPHTPLPIGWFHEKDRPCFP